MSSSLQSYFQKPNFGKLLLRVLLGGMMIAHGAPKFLGGSSTMETLGGAMEIYGITFLPIFWGFMAALTETVGGFMLILGYKTRFIALLLTFVMLTASLQIYDQGKGEFLAVAWPAELGIVYLSLIFIGAGKFSLDRD